jgi:cardiolipin synthase
MNEISQLFWTAVGDIWEVIYIATAIGIIIVVILDNRNPTRTLAWILALTFFPIIGVLAYIFLGQNFRRSKMFSRKGLQDLTKLKILSDMQLTSLNEDDLSDIAEEVTEKTDIIRLLLKNSNAVITPNDKVTILNDGPETYESIFEACEKAEKYIHIEYYILKLGLVGTRLFEILKRKAKEGVDVRVIYDSVGSMGMRRKRKREIRESGIKLESFIRIYFPLFSSRSNYRNHRKIVVVDGDIGFTGGVNIADYYVTPTRRLGQWRDTFVRIEGSSVRALDAIFCSDWYFVTKEKILARVPKTLEYSKIDNLCQIIQGSPDTDWKIIHQFYFSAITSAKKSVYVTTPYFIPNDEIISAMKIAALRGVDVKLVLPEKTDSYITKWCSETYLGELLMAGVQIYKYQPCFVHSKVMIVDNVISSIGTANMDYRSLETNFEVNAVFYDKQIAEDLTKHFLDDVDHSIAMAYKEWQSRPVYKKFIQSITRLLAPAM